MTPLRDEIARTLYANELPRYSWDETSAYARDHFRGQADAVFEVLGARWVDAELVEAGADAMCERPGMRGSECEQCRVDAERCLAAVRDRFLGQ